MAGAGPARLFCTRGTNEKDLGQLAQDQQRVLIPDNSQASHVFRPHSARPVAYWFVNMSGTEPPLSEQPSRVDDRYSGLMQPQPGSQDLPQTKGPTPHMRTYP